MIKIWAVIGFDGEVHARGESKEQLEKAMGDFLPFANIEQIDYNDAPITERGEKAQAKIRELMKDVRKVHFNLQKGFYALSIDERFENVAKWLEDMKDPNYGYPVHFHDSPSEHQQHVIDWEDEFPETAQTSRDRQAQAHGY
jgi:hypothetical protein